MKDSEDFKKIVDTISEMNQNGECGTLFLHGDKVSNEIGVCTKGDPIILSASFAAQMDNNPKFNQLMMAMFGAYLSGNVVKKNEFFYSLKLMEVKSGLN